MLLVIILFSAIAGSFFNSLIYRLNNGVSLFNPRYSMCPQCRHRLTASDLIPIFSYIFSRGKCRYCGKPISAQYLWLEVCCVVVGVIGFFLNVPWAAIALNLVLVAIIFSDLQYREIPYTLSGLALLCILFQPLSADILANLAVLGSFWLLIIVLERWYYHRAIFGGADIILFGFGALIFSLPQFMLFFYLTFGLGLLGAAILILFFKYSMKSTIPFAPYIIFGFWLTMVFGRPILTWYGSLWHG